MDEKVSIKAVEKYGEVFSSQVLKKAYAGKSVVNGPDLLTLTEVKQINYFILHELFTVWKAEVKNLQSPYFDYSDPAVKESLENFLGTLSNHITIKQADLKPLLARAVSQTLFLILDPYDFYSDLIAGDKNKMLSTDVFKEHLKYIKINSAPLNNLIEKIEEKKLKQISGNEAFGILDQILEEVNFTPEDFDEYFAKLSEVVPLKIEQLYEPRQVVTKKVEVLAQPSINDKLSKTGKTIADDFQRINRIKENLTINQKFMFTKVLFYGDFESFSKTVDELDNLADMPSALMYLERNLAQWDKESEEFHEFMEMLEKRFA
ncbi:MAG: hypothetical protein L0Y35_07865 [Flammeovirgaceae bacterium]|nr:hypothetical protein [Flammeovirgaceae bacterium]